MARQELRDEARDPARRRRAGRGHRDARLRAPAPGRSEADPGGARRPTPCAGCSAERARRMCGGPGGGPACRMQSGRAPRVGAGFGPAGRVAARGREAVSRSPAGSCSSGWSRCRSCRSSAASSSRGRCPGDVELLQMCAAFASSAFFAYCHLANGDVKVDFFTHSLSPRVVAALDCVGSLLVGAVRRADRVADRGGRAGRARGRRDVGGARLAGLDRAGADGAGVRAARGRRVLHGRACGCVSCRSHCDERHRSRLRRSSASCWR